MNNEKTNINKRRTARIVTVASGLLFVTFSIVYLAVFQKDVLEALHYSLAQGKTKYSPWGSAFFITFVLMVLCWAINAFVRLKGPLKSLSYFPSCLLLGVLTDVGYGVYQGEGFSMLWGWLLPLLLGIFLLLGLLVRKVICFDAESESDVMVNVNSNLSILLVLCLMTVGIGNTNIHFHHELQMEEALRRQDYEEAFKVAEQSMDPSRNLTALRAYAMSREGSMGEKLFHYPQLYGASGLLLEGAKERALRLNVDSLYVYLGNRPALGESALGFFRRICKEETGNYTTLDYYLSALLLEKKLDEFVKEYEELYIVCDSIPTYYRQALYLYGRMNGDCIEEISDESLEALWLKYVTKQEELSGERGEANRMRREFGDTYWWYYQYK